MPLDKKLEAAQNASVAHLLFKTGRLINEDAISRVRKRLNLPNLRVSHTALFPFLDFEGIKLTELSQKVGVTKQAVGRLVDELEAMGAVERCHDKTDGRAKLIRYTEPARDWVMSGLNVLGEIEKELGDAIGADQMTQLHQTLLTILEALESEGQ